jgi:lactoylglutathione lyase
VCVCAQKCPDPKGEEASAFTKTLFNPVLELTHNHGTENDADFAHFTGNEVSMIVP